MTAQVEGATDVGVGADQSRSLAGRLMAVSGYAWGVTAVTALTLVSRLALLGSVPRFWGDEAFTGVAVRHPLFEMLDVVRHDNHPPLLYLLLHGVAVVSTAPAALRLVSALAGVAMVPLAAALGRRVRGDWAGILAGLALGAFPLFLLISRDTRMYALVTTIVLGAALALWRAIEQPTRGRLVVYALVVLVAVYTHYFAVFAVSAQLLLALVVFRPPLPTAARVTVACALGGLTLLPWLVVALPQFQHFGDPFWLPKVTPETMAADVQHFLGLPVLDKAAVVAQWTSQLAGVVAIAIFWRRLPSDRRAGATYLLASTVLPTAALLLTSFWKPLYDARFAGIFWGTGVVVLGASLTIFRRRWIALGLIGLMAVAAAASLLQIHNPDYDTLLAPVAARFGPDDLVVVNGPTHYFSVAYGLGPRSAGSVRVVAGDIPWFFGVAGYPPGTHVRQVPYVLGRVFLVTELDQQAPAMPAGLARVDHSCQLNVCLDEYSR